MWEDPKRLEQTIKRLTREIAEIDEALYAPGDDDPILRAGILERKRDDAVRSAVLQLHTAIEDLLTSLILYSALDITDRKLRHRIRSERGNAFCRMLYDRQSLGFDMKLNFATGLGLISSKVRAKLMELNTMRHRYSHNWILNAVVRRGKKPKQPKPPLLRFRGKDLHSVAVLKAFIAEFGGGLCQALCQMGGIARRGLCQRFHGYNRKRS